MTFIYIALAITTCCYGIIRLIVSFFENRKEEQYLSIIVIVYSLSIIVWMW